MKGLPVVAGAERFGILIEEKPGCILTKDWSFRLPLCVCGILHRWASVGKHQEFRSQIKKKYNQVRDI